MASEKETGRVGLSRREFVRAGGAAALSAAAYRRVLGANDRVGVGFIGFGLIGKRHVLDFKDLPDVDAVGLAEAHRGRLDEGVATLGGSARSYPDFRKLLDDRDVQAVVVSTPDHWHALMTMMACAAGKDVYVEKPLTLFVREGRWMIDVAKRHGRVVQVGTQQRSGPHYQKARELIRDGYLGKVISVQMGSFRNIMPGFGRFAECDPPPELDYDLWLGPAPKRPYTPHRGLYHFRWFWDYSGGQMTNLAAHAIDIVHWYLGADAPTAVTSAGGRFCLQDDGETPDTQDTIFEYPGFLATWSHREASRGGGSMGGLEFFGPKGGMAVSRRGYTITPDRKVDPDSVVPQFGGPHPVGGPTRSGGSSPSETWTEARKDESGDQFDQFRRHARNFVDCVKSRGTPISDLEGGHRVATACHLANISLRVGRKLRWDPDREAILDDSEAAGMLEKPYRAPWDSILKSLLTG